MCVSDIFYRSCFSFSFRCLLWSPNVDVSYFAAGIVAHLVCASHEAWNDPNISKEDLLEELVSRLALYMSSKVDFRSFNIMEVIFILVFSHRFAST